MINTAKWQIKSWSWEHSGFSALLLIGRHWYLCVMMNLLWKDMNPYYYQHCLVRCCRNLAEKVACFPRKCRVSESDVAVRGSQEIKKHKGKDYLSTGERAVSAYQEYLNHWLSLLVMRKTIFHCQDTKSHWLQKEITCAVKHKCTEMTRCRTAT